MRLKLRRALFAAPIFAFAVVAGSQVFAAQLYSNGFETDTSGWFNTSRVVSGTNGVTSASGAYHGEVGTSSVSRYTDWGQYNNSTGGSAGSFQGFTTSLNIYLNVGLGAANDTRFDFSTALNTPTGVHAQDFVFNVGFYNSTDTGNPGAGTNRFVVSASNNAGRANSYPMNPGRDPFAISASGWYTFQHTFTNNGGNLLATLSLIDAANLVVATWELGGTPISGFGGNRYGWFANQEFSFLAIDNASLSGPDSVPVPFALPLFASGMGMISFMAWRRKRKADAAAA